MADEDALANVFIRLYTALPADERSRPLVEIDGVPHNWVKAYNEIINKTPLGNKILKKLRKYNII